MRIPLRIDMEELYEYRDELNALIEKCEKINTESESVKKQLFQSGVSDEDLDTVISILAGEDK